MQATPEHSAACCNVPPVIAEGYEPKGSYETIGGRKTYVSGSSTAETAILYVADIFGFKSQTLQGADILSTSVSDHQRIVFVPDFFDGRPADISWYPPTNDEQRKALGEFFQNQGSPPKAVARIPGLVKEFEERYPSIKSWAIVGFCWGGKVVTLTCQGSTHFKAAAQCHPAMVDGNDANGVIIPMVLLASKDEDPEEVEKFKNGLKVKNHVETFGDQIHGWMAARSDLQNSRVRGEYERGYKILVEFFHQHI